MRNTTSNAYNVMLFHVTDTREIYKNHKNGLHESNLTAHIGILLAKNTDIAGIINMGPILGSGDTLHLSPSNQQLRLKQTLPLFNPPHLIFLSLPFPTTDPHLPPSPLRYLHLRRPLSLATYLLSLSLLD